MRFSDSVPAYPGGCPASALYNAGPTLASDQFGPSAEDCPMQLICDTNEAEFCRYLRLCQAAGFEIVFENQTPVIHAAQLKKGSLLLYGYLTRLSGEVRLIEDRHSSALPDFSESADTSRTSATVVQYGLYYDPDNNCTQTTVNCGMLYLVLLEDRRLFVIDGGHILQCSDEAMDGLWRFLRELTGTAENEPVRVAGWYFTHAHNDHMAACCRLLHAHHEQIEIQRFLLNYPSYQTIPWGYELENFILIDTLNQYCPGVPCLKLHTGQTFTLGNATFEILYTHEDAVNREGKFPFLDFNCTSTILRMTTAGKTVLWLGDTNCETEALLQRVSLPEIWKSDVVQVAHHCFNYLTTLYGWIDAGSAMLPNSFGGAHQPENVPKLADIQAHLDNPDSIWYEDHTTIFTFCDGKWTALRQYPCIGGPHDGTDLLGVHHRLS